MKSINRYSWLLAGVLSTVSPVVFAESLSWPGGDGLWSDAAAWGGALPSSASDVTISGAATVTMDADADAHSLSLTAGASLLQTGGVFRCVGGFDGVLALGSVADGGDATYRMESGMADFTGNPHVGRYGKGLFELAGGMLVSWGYLSVGRYSTGDGTLIVDGSGILDKTGHSMLVGEEGVGLCVVKDGGEIRIASDVPFEFGAPGGLWIAWAANARGTLRLESGGRISTPHVLLANAGATLVLDGGVLTLPAGMATGTISDFICQRAGHVYVGPRGAIFDTGSSFCVVPASMEPLDGTSTGGLVKLGGGTLSLSGVNTWTGGTIVSNGSLSVNAAVSLPGYDRPGGVTLCAGTTLLLGDAWTSEQIAALRANIVIFGDGRIDSGATLDVSNGDVTIAEDLNWEERGSPEMVGDNVLTLTGRNSFSGDFTTRGGILKADIGQGLDARHAVVLSGGTLASNVGVITNALGTGPGEIAIPVSIASGFTAMGGPLEVNLGNGATLVAGSADFSPDPFILNAARADGTLTFRNPIDLDGHSMNFTVQGSTATLAGAVTNAVYIYKKGPGELVWDAPLSLSAQYKQDEGVSRIQSRFQTFGTTDISGKIWNTGNSRMIFADGADVWLENDYFQETPVELVTRMESNSVMEVMSEFAVHKGTFEVDGGTLFVKGVGDSFGVGCYFTLVDPKEDAKRVGCLTLRDGEIQANCNVQIGRNGPGTFTQLGGHFLTTMWPCAGRQPHGVGTMDFQGGVFDQTNPDCGLVVGEDGIGHVRIDGTAQVNLAGSYGLYYLVRPNGQSGDVNLDGGTLSVRKITCTANGTSRVFRFNGGTLRTTEPQEAFISGALTSFEVGTFGGVVDTVGNDVTFNQPLTAAGVGAPVHRWSFNGDWRDSVGGGEATCDGNVTLGETSFSLPGGAYGTGAVNLGAGLLPTNDVEGFTIELWARHDGAKTWSRVFEIGDAQPNYFLMAWSMGTSLTQAAIGINGKRFGEGEWLNMNALGGFALGTEFHIAVTMTPNGDGTWTMTGYKQDAVTGQTLAISTQKTGVGWLPSNQPSDNFWLGRSLTVGDQDACATYNEVRVWDHALSEADLSASARRGPDASIQPFEKTGAGRLTLTGANSVPGAVRVSAGTLALAAGASLAAPDGVTVATNATLALAADVPCPARLRFEARDRASGCLTHAGTLDLSGVDIAFADSSDLVEGRSFVVARAEGGITGTPTAKLPKGWTLRRSGNELSIGSGGIAIFVR